MASNALVLPTAEPQLKINKAALTPRLTTARIDVTVDTRASDLFRCGTSSVSGYTAKTPALSWDVTEDFDLGVRILAWGDSFGILVFPDHSFLCSVDDNEFRAHFPKGRYHLYLFGTSSTASAKVRFSSESQARAIAPLLAVTAATSSPTLVTSADVWNRGGYNKVFHDSNYQLECTTSSYVSDVPSAFVEVAKPTATMRISVWGKNHNGTVIVAGGKTWIYCTSFMTAPPGGWPAGKIEIYPLGKLDQEGNTYSVIVDDPAVPARDATVQTIKLDKKLAKPMFLTVPIRKGRNVLPEALSGSGCGENAFAGIPDVIATLSRPIPGLVIRPLPSAHPVEALLRYPGQSYCVDGARWHSSKRGHRDNDASGAFDEPTWHATNEVHDLDEGTYEIQFGTKPGEDVDQITLMIYDDSTELSPLELAAIPASALGEREIFRVFPQLQIKRLMIPARKNLELAAAVFAAVPRDLFVTPAIDLDTDLVRSFGLTADRTVPAKGEPLLVLDSERGSATVLAADGLTFEIDRKRLVELPAGAPPLPAKPRPINPDTKIETLAALLPSKDTRFAAYEKAVVRNTACRDKAWAPYGRRLPTIERPGGVDIVVVKSPAYNRIEEAGDRAMDRACGTEEAFEKKTEGMRVKMLAAFEASRPELMKMATAKLR